MKKSYLIITAAALLAAASCQKSDNAPASGVKYNPVEVVLSAAIEGVDTKVGYTEDANALKAAWVKDDAISLVAIDASGKILSNDIFTTTTAGPVAKFSGTYSNPDGAESVSVFYPALTEGNGTASSPWECKTKVLYGGKVGSEFLSVASNLNVQGANADPSFLAESVVMKGKITKTDIPALVSSSVKATLKNTCYIVKATVTLPSTVNKVSKIKLMSSVSILSAIGWSYADDRFLSLYGGTAPEPLQTIQTRLDNFAPASDGTVTAWMLGYEARYREIASGETLTLTVNTDTGDISKAKTLAAKLTFEAGKIYRLTVDMTK